MRSAWALTLLFGGAALAAEPLPALEVQSRATASGVSAGAYMAVQLQVAHSASIDGVGAIAGGPYYCARGQLWAAYYNCMAPRAFTPLPPVTALRDETEKMARAGRIDPTANLALARVWLFTGSKDETVTPPVVQALHAFYSGYKAASVLVSDKPAGHGMVTLDAGNKDCSATRSPFINDCDYDAAGEMLKHLLGPLAPPAATAEGRLMSFDQRPFGGQGISMDDEAFVYVPAACESAGCRVHVAFHGCRQGRSEIADRFAREAGYNRWADSNRIVVLYPQAIARVWWTYNPKGCWDWWGYTGAQYHTKEGAQIRAVKAMLERLSAPRMPR